MNRTVVINLFSGSGAGKSTTAAALYAKMKQQGYHVELVREYIKDWAWLGHKPSEYDQMYITGQQIRAESLLYHKVDYIITDSPFLLGPFYEEFNTTHEITKASALNFYNYATGNNIVYANYFLVRKKKFDPRGRYEDENRAKQVDKSLKNWLWANNIDFTTVNVSDTKRVSRILKDINGKYKTRDDNRDSTRKR